MNKPVKKILTISTLLLTGMHLFNQLTDVQNTPVIPSKNDKTFLWKNMKINYTEKGDSENPALLLIHNLSPSSSKEEWNCIFDALSKQFHVFALDLPGCGKSDKPNITYINYMYVQLTGDFIKKVIRKKATVCASAFSSSFTLMAAHMYSEVIDKIAVINPTPLQQLYTPVSKEGKAKEMILQLPVLGTFLYNCIMSKETITDAYKYMYFYNEQNIPENAIDLSYYHAHYNHSSGKYLFGSIAGNYTTINLIHTLPKINHKICFIGNQNYKNTIEEYQKYNPAIQTISISHCRLLPQMEIPETIIQILLELSKK